MMMNESIYLYIFTLWVPQPAWLQQSTSCGRDNPKSDGRDVSVQSERAELSY